ncbi:MAG: TraB/GumN family protein, partial [Bacteroidia bacterium]
LWQISGNGLKKPSYLFGTYHLLTNRFLDSLPVIGQKFDAAEVLVSEVLLDNNAIAKMDEVMKPGTSTLDKLLSPEDYILVSEAFKKLIGVDLEPFNQYNPMAVNLLFYQFLLKEAMPQKTYKNTELGMDLYLQKYATQIKKPTKALENIDVQMNALFSQFTEKRQAEMLVDAVKNIDQSRREIIQSISCYKKQDLVCLDKMVYDATYKPVELDVLLYNRNNAWLKILPAQIASQSSFIAVGAGHLLGKEGLVEGLRAQGYTLTPVSLK